MTHGQLLRQLSELKRWTRSDELTLTRAPRTPCAVFSLEGLSVVNHAEMISPTCSQTIVAGSTVSLASVLGKRSEEVSLYLYQTYVTLSP